MSKEKRSMAEDFEIVRSSADTRTLVDNDARRCSDDDLFARVFFLFARLVVFAPLFIFRLSFLLLDPIN